jgi:hypothetical protein
MKIDKQEIEILEAEVERLKAEIAGKEEVMQRIMRAYMRVCVALLNALMLLGKIDCENLGINLNLDEVTHEKPC